MPAETVTLKTLGEADLKPLSVAEVQGFESRLADTLEFAGEASMALSRVYSGLDHVGLELPADYRMSEETFVAFSMLAASLELHRDIIDRHITNIREGLPWVYWERGAALANS